MIPQKDSCPGRNTEQEAERNGGGKGDVCYSGYSYHYVAYHEAAGQPEENAGYGYDDIRSIHGDGAYNKPCKVGKCRYPAVKIICYRVWFHRLIFYFKASEGYVSAYHKYAPFLFGRCALPAFVFTSTAKAAAFYAYLPVGGYVQFHSSPTAVQVYVGFSGCYVRVAQVDGSTAEIGAYVRSLEKLVEYDVAYGTQGVVGVEESVVRLALLFLLLSHSLVHHPLYHLGTAMHCPLVCPVSPMVMSEKEDADEDKGQGPQHGLEIAGE